MCGIGKHACIQLVTKWCRHRANKLQRQNGKWRNEQCRFFFFFLNPNPATRKIFCLICKIICKSGGVHSSFSLLFSGYVKEKHALCYSNKPGFSFNKGGSKTWNKPRVEIWQIDWDSNQHRAKTQSLIKTRKHLLYMMPFSSTGSTMMLIKQKEGGSQRRFCVTKLFNTSLTMS